MESYIEGLYYIPNFIDDEELAAIYEEINNADFQPISNKSRVVAQYGYKYHYLGNIKPTLTATIPDLLCEIATAERLAPYITLNENLDQLIINKYATNQSISAHCDHVKFFGPVIACLSIGGSATATFTSIKRPLHKVSIKLEEKSLYIMTGKSRYEYKHEISKPTSDRYSLTYRSVNK